MLAVTCGGGGGGGDIFSAVGAEETIDNLIMQIRVRKLPKSRPKINLFGLLIFTNLSRCRLHSQ